MTQRTEIQQFLTDNGISSLIHYPIPMHKQEAYKEFSNYSYPIAERMADQVLSLPISPVMSDEEVEYVVIIINFWKK